MEEALRADLQGAMTEAADAQIIAGNGTAPSVSGFGSALTAPENPSAVADFAAYASTRAKQVDGRYAQSEDDVKILVGAATYQHAGGSLSVRFRGIGSIPSYAKSESACPCCRKQHSGGIRMPFNESGCGSILA